MRSWLRRHMMMNNCLLRRQRRRPRAAAARRRHGRTGKVERQRCGPQKASWAVQRIRVPADGEQRLHTLRQNLSMCSAFAWAAITRIHQDGSSCPGTCTKMGGARVVQDVCTMSAGSPTIFSHGSAHAMRTWRSRSAVPTHLGRGRGCRCRIWSGQSTSFSRRRRGSPEPA